MSEFENQANKLSQEFEEAQRILFGPRATTSLQLLMAETFLKQNGEALASQLANASFTHDESQIIKLEKAFSLISMGVYHWKSKPKGTDNGYRINTKMLPLI